MFKRTTADNVEGGLAGLVNVKSHKPFDFDGFQIAGAARAQYASRSQKTEPNGSLLITDRWDTGIGEVGVLITGSYTRLQYLDSTRSNTDFAASDGTSVRFPDIQRIDYGSGDRQRPSLNGAVQWRPMPGLEFYAEALWQGFRNKVSDRELEVPLHGAQSYSNIVVQPGGNLAQSLTAVNPNRPDGFQGASSANTDTYQFAIGGSYDAGPLKISADVARTTSKFIDSIYSFDMAYVSQQTVNAGFSGKNGPSFSFVNGPDLSAAPTCIFRGFFDRQLIAKGDDVPGWISPTIPGCHSCPRSSSAGAISTATHTSRTAIGIARRKITVSR